MKIIQKVLIKQIITENSKSKLKEKFRQQKMQLEQECQQLLFEQKKMQRKYHTSQPEGIKKFQAEIKRRKEEMDLLAFKKKQVDLLKMGSEMTETEVDALVEVNVGSHWKETMDTKAIVIKDNVVVRIDK